MLDLLTEAYVGGYIDMEYGRETAEEALKFLGRFKDEFGDKLR